MSLLVWLPMTGHLNNQGLLGGGYFNNKLWCNSITNYGATISDNGVFGKCYDFTTSQYIQISGLPFSNLKTASISFWIKLPTNEGNWLPFTGQTTSYYIMATAHGTGVFYHQNISGTKTIYMDGNVVTAPQHDGNWHHYCIIDVNFSSWTNFYINYFGSTSSVWNWNGSFCDLRIYDHVLSVKEIKELSKGLALHYPLNDPNINSYTNLVSNETNYPGVSPSFYNGATGVYGYGNSNVYRTSIIDENYPEKKIVKVYCSTETASINPYVYFLNFSPGTIGVSKTISFDIYPHSPNKTNGVLYFYTYSSDLCDSTICNETTGQKGSCLNSSTTLAISLIQDKWNHIICTITKTVDNTNNGWGFCPVVNANYTSNGTDYWLFKDVQITTTKSEMPYIYPQTSNIMTTSVFDNSGHNIDGTVYGNIYVNENSPRYKRSYQVIDNGYIIYPLPHLQVFTYSLWFKRNRISHSNREMIGTGWYGTSIELNPNNTLTFKTYTNTEFNVVSLITFTSTDTWYHLCLTRNLSGDIRIYVNGVFDNGRTHENSNQINYTSYNAELFRYSNESYQFQGSISDFRIYGTVLSNDDILALYNKAGYIDNISDICSYEFDEIETSKVNVNKNGILTSNNIVEPDSISNASFNNSGIANSKNFYEI